LIGRAATANRDFEALKKDIISALQKIHTIRPAAVPTITEITTNTSNASKITSKNT
jgi:hypothetical protein